MRISAWKENSELRREEMTSLEVMRREFRQKFARLKSNPDRYREYETRLRQADTIFVLALDLYEALWDQFPEHREELVDKIESMIEVFEKTLERMRGLAA